jgi:glucans biosynthesis protein
MSSEPMNARRQNQQPVQFQTARQCGARTRRGQPCRSAATKKGRCRLHGGASGSGGPPGKRNGQYRHGERTKAAFAERRRFSALLKMLRAGLTNT